MRLPGVMIVFEVFVLKSRSDCNCPCHSGAPVVHPVACCDGLWREWRVEFARQVRGAELQFTKYAHPNEAWDHDHCEACFAKFMEAEGPDIFTEGYVTTDGERWVCQRCFRDLKEAMGWTLVA
jgi:hypothetical protein